MLSQRVNDAAVTFSDRVHLNNNRRPSASLLCENDYRPGISRVLDNCEIEILTHFPCYAYQVQAFIVSTARRDMPQIARIPRSYFLSSCAVDAAAVSLGWMPPLSLDPISGMVET